MPVPRRPKPWRGFPSVNAVHGLRMRIQQASPDPGRGEVAFSAVGASGAKSMGTIPAGCIPCGFWRNIETLFASSATLDVGIAAAGTTVVTSVVMAPGTAARGEVAMGAGGNMPLVDTEIWVTMGTAVAATGCADLLFMFYVNKD